MLWKFLATRLISPDGDSVSAIFVRSKYAIVFTVYSLIATDLAQVTLHFSSNDKFLARRTFAETPILVC